MSEKVLASLCELSEWMRAHTGPRDGTHDMLVRAAQAIAEAQATKEPYFHVQADWVDAQGQGYDAAYGFGAGEDRTGDEAEMVGTADEIADELRRYLKDVDKEFVEANAVHLVLKVSLMPEGKVQG